MKYLTRLEYEVIRYHITQVIAWEEGGSFIKENKKGEMVFDKVEARRAKKALEKLRAFVK
jgi:hypothetical protein